MELSGRTVVVTGGAGFIGSHLVDVLLARGNRVVVIDDFSSGSRANLAHQQGHDRLSIAEIDVCDSARLEPAIAGSECVFHLATRSVRLSLAQPSRVHEVNTTGTFNVLKAAARHGVGRFLYCSSSEVNGTADVVPMPEQYVFRPETIYGASKLAGEYYAQVFFRSGWLPVVIARPHNNYGPREHYEGSKAEVIPRFILQAFAGIAPTIYGEGTQTRDFTYVSETADYLVRLAESDAALGKTYNVCRSEEVSIRQIASLVSELVAGPTGLRREPIFLPARPSDVLRLYGDNGALRELLGSAPRVGIRDGLERTVRWFRENVDVTPELLGSLKSENWTVTPLEPWLAALRAR